MEDMLNNMRLAAPAADGVLVQLLTRWAAAGRQPRHNNGQPASEPSHGAATGERADSPALPGSPSVLEAAEHPAKRARRHTRVAPEDSVSDEMVRACFTVDTRTILLHIRAELVQAAS